MLIREGGDRKYEKSPYCDECCTRNPYIVELATDGYGATANICRPCIEQALNLMKNHEESE